MSTTHAIHEDHDHQHGPDCGHASVVHDDHVDDYHDGCVHREHDGYWDECDGAHTTHAVHDDHEHGLDCGHEAVSHGDHVDDLHDVGWNPANESGDWSLMIATPRTIRAWKSVDEITGRTIMRNGEWATPEEPRR